MGLSNAVLRRIGALGAGLLACGALSAVPAHASTTPQIDALFNQGAITLSPGTPGKTVQLSVYAGVDTAAPTTLTHVVVTIDVSGIAAVATLTGPAGECAKAGNLITCALPDLSVSGPGGAAGFSFSGSTTLPFKAVPVSGAAAGATGSATVTASAVGGGVAPSSNPDQVSLADGVDLVSPYSPLAALQPISVRTGFPAPVIVSFSNAGDQAAQGVTVEVRSDYGISFASVPSNCYSGVMANDTLDSMVCYFDGTVAAGQTVELTSPIMLDPTADLKTQWVGLTVQPGHTPLSTDYGYVAGTAPAIALGTPSGSHPRPLALRGHLTARSSVAAAQQTDIDPGDNAENFTATATNTAIDLAAVGSTNSGKPGGTVQVSLGVANDGTGFYECSRAGDAFVGGRFTVPAGTTATTVPSYFTPVVNGVDDTVDQGKAGYSVYDMTLACLLKPGDHVTATVTLTLGAGFTGASGSMAMSIVGLSYGAPEYTPALDDENPSNDVAAIVVNRA